MLFQPVSLNATGQMDMSIMFLPVVPQFELRIMIKELDQVVMAIIVVTVGWTFALCLIVL